MRKVLFLLVMVLTISSLAFSAGTKKTLSTGLAKDRVDVYASFTVGASYIDTVVYHAEPNLATLTFFIYATDSIAVDYVTVRRNFTGGVKPAAQTLTIDTLAGFTAWAPNATIQGAACAKYAAVTIAPLATEYYFIVDLNASGVGVTSTTAYYGVTRTFNYER